MCPSKNANSYRNHSIPLESAFAPGVEKTDAQHQEKRQHLNEAEQAEVAEENCPGIEKHHLNVEENEENRRHVEANAEAPECRAGRWIAALERVVLDGIRRLRTEQGVERDHRPDNDRAEDAEDHDRNVGAHE